MNNSVMNLNAASPNNFVLVFPKLPTLPSIEEGKKLTLNIFGTLIPGWDLGVTNIDWQGGKVKISSGELTFSNWTTNYIVDSNFENWKIFYDWSMYIHSGKEHYGAQSQNVVSVTPSIILYNNYHIEMLKVDLHDAFPVNCGDVDLSYQSGREMLTSSITFAFNYITIEKFC